MSSEACSGAIVLNLWAMIPLGGIEDPFTGVTIDYQKTQVFTLGFITVTTLCYCYEQYNYEVVMKFLYDWGKHTIRNCSKGLSVRRVENHHSSGQTDNHAHTCSTNWTSWLSHLIKAPSLCSRQRQEHSIARQNGEHNYHGIPSPKCTSITQFHT